MNRKFKPGVSFSDFVVQDYSATKSKLKETGRRDYRRGWLVWVGVVLGFATILVRLAVLQLFEGGKYRVLADENRIKQIKLPAPRAEIVDREGRLIAGNEKNGDKWVRKYFLGEAGGHLTGYVNEVAENEIDLLKTGGKKYELKDQVGRLGLEEIFESKLRGVDGGRVAEVDNTGEVVRELGSKLPVSNQPLQTSFDKELLEVAYRALDGKKGAVVASVPENGQVLVLTSSPGFDPNKIAEDYERLSSNPDLPFLNRAISGAYAPGSTFKMITTIAAIESGKVESDYTFNDQGVITVGSFRYTNWLYTKRGGTEGTIGFSRAITRSTDTFFYKVGELLGPEKILDWAKKMGLGQKTGINTFGEVTGGLPDISKAWYLGNTYHLAIGQSDLLTTPLQINFYTNVLATGGKKCKPQILKNIKPDCVNMEISKKTIDIVHRGMEGACLSGGTAFPIFDWNDAAKQKLDKSLYAKRAGESLPLIACKTGTAEYVNEKGQLRTHAWLTAYAPADDPEISVTAFLEGGGEGSNAAAPVVRKVMAKYFGVEDTYPYDKIPQEVGE